MEKACKARYKIFHCLSAILSLSFHMTDYLVHRPVSIFRHVRAIGKVGNITRCFYRTLEGKLIVVKQQWSLSFEREIKLKLFINYIFST